MSADIVDPESIELSNEVDNFYRYIDNLRLNPAFSKEMVDKFRDRVLYLFNKHPFAWQVFSDNPKGAELTRKEALRRIDAIAAQEAQGLIDAILRRRPTT